MRGFIDFNNRQLTSLTSFSSGEIFTVARSLAGDDRGLTYEIIIIIGFSRLQCLLIGSSSEFTFARELESFDFISLKEERSRRSCVFFIYKQKC
ncbi:unnamed protein product [Arabidopsis halleri]